MHKFLYGLRNLPALIRSWLLITVADVAAYFGVVTAYGKLYLKHIKADGTVVDYGFVSARVVTDAGVAFLCLDWGGGTKDITNFNSHASGTGTTAEAAAQTALVTEVAARSTGTKTNPTAPQVQTVGTIAYAGTFAITEHGIFDSNTPAGSTLWDRSVFAAINVVSGDSIQFTYVVTFPSGS